MTKTKISKSEKAKRKKRPTLTRTNREEKEGLKRLRETIKSYLNICLFVEQGLGCCRDECKNKKAVKQSEFLR